MKIIFGLGNPGQQYKNNRHNIGFAAVDELACKLGIKFKKSFKTPALIAKKSKGEVILFVKSRTFMNNSGICVRKVVNSYKVPVEDILIIYDDVDLALGAIRFRQKGSSGGHRGISSIISALGTEEINRLKIGISNAKVGELSEYVLSDFTGSEQSILQEVTGKVACACMDWINQGIESVMKNYNKRNSTES